MSIKRALVCAPLMPEYDRESGSRRVYHLIEFLRQSGWAVSFVAENGQGSERYVRILEQRGVATYTGFECLTDQFIVANRFDLAIFAFWYIAELHLPTIRALSPQTRVIVDSIDLHYVRNARRMFCKAGETRVSGMLDHDYASEMIREVNTYAAADAVLTVSQKEADLIHDLIGDPLLAYVVPDNEDLAPSLIPFEERKGILFLGNFRHLPNIGAAEYLCKDILPQLDPAVMAEHPAYIVGNALDGTVRSYGSGLPHVHMVGWVPSVLPYLQHARISVLPLLYGAGTKRKLIQALMTGTPTVSTSVGVEGLNLCHGEHVLIADNPAAFAHSITQLLEDQALWQHLNQHGRAHITPIHGREAAQARLMQVISNVLARPAKLATFAGMTSELHQHRPKQQYQQLIYRIRQVVSNALPVGAKVIVVSKGDDDLLQLDNRQGWHFPQTEGAGPERLFAQGATGSAEISWLRAGRTYEFRLYKGLERNMLLATVKVTWKDTGVLAVSPEGVPSYSAGVLTVVPNQDLTGDGISTPTITWSTGDGSEGQVYMSEHNMYAGYYPANSAAAIAHLEALRNQGGDYLLFPSTAFWWLDYYAEFKQYLDHEYHMVVRQEDICLIYALRKPTTGARRQVRNTRSSVVQRGAQGYKT
jgi:glycosyltransferase involved in cell wall biosynthesis